MLVAEIQEKMLDENLSEAEAIAIAESGRYRDIGQTLWAVLQLKQKMLCCDFGYFHECVEFACGRTVFNFEVINHPDRLCEEIFGVTLDEATEMLRSKVITVNPQKPNLIASHS